MDNSPTEKNLELERLVFFSDAVVAIAITLLALDLKIERASPNGLTFSDIGHSWQKFLAFFLSFFMIAVFWVIHHQFFFYIKKVDRRLMIFNLGWLLFIVILPFSSTLVSEDLFNTTAIFIYSATIFAITCFQNMIWDYASGKPDFLKPSITERTNSEFRVACNLAMVNSILAMIVSFFSPVLAFIILFTRTIMFRLSAINFLKRAGKKKDVIESGKKQSIQESKK